MNRNSDTVDAVSTPREPVRVPVTETQVSVADLAGGRLWELLDLYHAVIETVVTAETPEAIEQGVCAALTDRGRFDFACLGAVGDDGTTPSIRTVGPRADSFPRGGGCRTGRSTGDPARRHDRSARTERRCGAIPWSPHCTGGRSDATLV